jgi:mono/diheme cytochrome c family protein
MLKRFTSTLFAATTFFSLASAQQPSVKLPVNETSVTSGKQMYVSYCAPCHGVDGRGHGPVASALKMPPTNLTMLSKNNQGKFPEYHLDSVLKFGSEMLAHGSAEMPVWGPTLTRMDTNDNDHSKAALRISNLTHYIETLQVK